MINKHRPHYIVHFAAQAINGVSFDSASMTLQTNIQGTLNVVEACRRVEGDFGRRTKILIAGSSAEYGESTASYAGEGTKNIPIPETARLEPLTPYGVSKVSQEVLARQYWLAHSVQSVTARIFNHMSAGGTEHISLQNFAKQIAEIELQHENRMKACSVLGGVGSSEERESCLREAGPKNNTDTTDSRYELLHGQLAFKRDVTDVVDSAPVFLQLMIAGTPGEAYNVGSGTAFSIKELLDAVMAHSRQDVPIIPVFDKSRLRAADETILRADVTKLRDLTGWEPNPRLARTAGSILDWWREEVRLRYE